MTGGLNGFQPDQIISSDTTIFLGESVQILTGGTCTSDFTWSPDEGLLGGDALNPIVMPEVSTTYTLTVNQDNCTVEDDIRISVVTSEELTCNDLSLPSAFTPNNDGVNDLFMVRGQQLKSYSLQVFNQWGGLLYSSKSQSDGWDGTSKGIAVSMGTYTYLIAYSDGERTKYLSGHVTLLR